MALAAAANDRSSATLANIASPSKSGSFDIGNPATMAFIHFYFENEGSATDLGDRTDPVTAPAGDSKRCKPALSSTLVSLQEWEARGFVDAEKLEQKERSGVVA